MSSSITGKEYPLSKIFSNDFEFHIPAYQRPYAWTETETGELFKDLYDFFLAEESENYFLGSIVLIKDELKPLSNVIDGQQRLTTLTILFAVMSDVFTDPEDKADMREYIKSKGRKREGIEAKPRLFLREKEREFFQYYIQDVRLDELDALDPAMLDTEAKRHVLENARLLRTKIKESFDSEDELVAFSEFIVNRCFLVAVYTPSQESAFRIFSVMNSRGLDLLPIDIIKSDTIGKLSDRDRDIYTAKWEELENETGRDGFNEVFTHTRTLFIKERPKKNLLEEFKEGVLPKTTPKGLIDDYLVPYTEAYVRLKNCEYESTQYAEEINEALYWLNKTNNYDWMPPAIKFLAEHPNDSAYFRWFIKKLERLASYLLVTARDVNQRFYRYNWLIVEMDDRPDTSLENPLKNIELTELEKKNFLEALGSEIYLMPAQRRNYIIQRLDSFVSCGGATYNAKIFTIEHVLPQNPNAESEWMELWPDASQRRYWLNRVANLVPLTRQKNSAAQNYDFATKKGKYFQTKNGTSSYTLTTQVLNIEAWTPEIVELRQEELLEVFRKSWDLKLDSSAELKEDDFVFLLAGRGGNASGYLVGPDEFVVQKGSRIAHDVTDGLPIGYKEARDKLVRDGVIVNDLFVEDHTFSSPSTAAAVVLGRSSNGRREWTCLDGRSLGTVSH